MALYIVKMVDIKPGLNTDIDSEFFQHAASRIGSVYYLHLYNPEFAAFAAQERRFYYLYKSHDKKYTGTGEYLMLAIVGFNPEASTITTKGLINETEYEFQILFKGDNQND